MRIKKAVVGLCMALTLTFCVLGYTLWQNFWWRLSVDYIAGEAGTAQAMSEFHKGRLILWEIDPTNNFPRFSGKYDGPFEIWLDEYNPEMSYPWQYMQAPSG